MYRVVILLPFISEEKLPMFVFENIEKTNAFMEMCFTNRYSVEVTKET